MLGVGNDNKIKGEANQKNYAMMVCDHRLGCRKHTIRAVDLDGGEPNLQYTSEGVSGIGFFDQMEIGSVNRQVASFRIGKTSKQIKLLWLVDDGCVIVYLASRIVPEGEYKACIEEKEKVYMRLLS